MAISGDSKINAAVVLGSSMANFIRLLDKA